MTLYVDDDSCASVLVAMLRKAGHDVLIPADIGMSGSHDAEHLLKCVQEQRAFLTKNYTDFDPIHKLIIGCSGAHTGIIIIREEDDKRKNMTFKASSPPSARSSRRTPTSATNSLLSTTGGKNGPGHSGAG